jgi:hypothetical protein
MWILLSKGSPRAKALILLVVFLLCVCLGALALAGVFGDVWRTLMERELRGSG